MNILVKKITIYLERYGFLLLASSTLVTFVLACAESHTSTPVTLSSVFEAMGETLARDRSYRGFWGKLMSIMGSATLAWAAIRIYMASAGFKWDEFAARRLARNHIVLIGDSSETGRNSADLGQAAMVIELAFLFARNNLVVLCMPSISEADRVKLWESGVIVVKGDLSVLDLLQATSASRARLLIAMKVGSEENIAIVRIALSPVFGRTSLKCICMVPPVSSRAHRSLQDYLEPDTLSRVRTFSDSELIARRMLSAYPPDEYPHQTDNGVHILIIGFSEIGQSMALQLARIGHYRNGKRVKVTLVDGNASQRWRELVTIYPTLPQWLEVQIDDMAIETVQSSDLARWKVNEAPIDVAYVCTRDEITNLRVARLLVRDLVRNSFFVTPSPRVVVLDPPGGRLLKDLTSHHDYQYHMRLFSLFDGDGEVQHRDFLWELDDQRAQTLHEAYCASDDARCANDPKAIRSPSNRPWDQLSETYREANRSSADHFDVKMRAIGCCIAKAGTATEIQITSDELELLARMEHDRWCADRSLNGWQFGEIRDDVRKLHPSMVPYGELSEATRQLDRDNVLQIIKIMKGTDGVLSRTTAD